MKKKISFIIGTTLLFSTLNVFSQLKDNLLKVQGDAITYVNPDILIVNISIESKDSMYQNCSRKLVNKYNEFKKALIKNNIDEQLIKSDDLNIREEQAYDFELKKRVFDCYKGSLGITIKLNNSPEKINAILNTLKNDSFKFQYNVSFDLSEVQKKYQLENSIELAIKDAKNKSNIIAKSLNIKLAEIKEINFGYTNNYTDLLTTVNNVDILVMESDSDSDSDNKIILNPRLIEIRKSIAIIWRIEQ